MRRDAEWVTDTDFLCPWCGHRQSDTWEFVGDLRGGDVHECQSCERPIEIVQIDYTAHLYIRRGEAKETP
jgi:transcription elongation factor Elf1